MNQNLIIRCIMALFLFRSSAGAQTAPSERDEPSTSHKVEGDALQSLKEGIRLYTEGDYKSALIVLEKVREKAPEKANPYRWLALTYARLGNCEAATNALGTFYLKSKKRDPRLEEVKKSVSECRPGGDRGSAETADAPSTSGGAPSVVSPPPSHPQHPEAVSALAPAPNAPSPPIAAVVQPAPPSQTPPTEVRPPVLPTPQLPEPTAPRRGLFWGGVTLLAAGVAVGVGGGVGFGLAADGKAAAIKAEQDQGDRFDPALDDARQLFQKLTYASWAVGGTLAVTGAILAGVGVRSSGNRESTRVTIAPAFAPGYTGFVAAGAF